MKKLTFWMLSACVAGMVAFTSCSSDRPDNPVDPNPEVVTPEDNPNELPAEVPYTSLKLSASQEAAKQANNDFAVSLLKDVMDLQNGESTVISPFSLYSALSMVANGDEGATRDEVLQVLGFNSGEKGLQDLNDFNSFLMSRLPNLDSRAYALVSNSFWFGNNMLVLPSFGNVLERFYGADVYSLPTIKDEAARRRINEWCSEKTKGMIPEFLKSNLTGFAALVNATYFRGIWADGFDKEFTKSSTFTSLNGSTSTVEMMQSTFYNAGYAKTEDAQLVSLPYGNGNFRMVCILPDQSTDFNAYAARMSAASLKDDFAKLSTNTCHVAMPKFDIGSRQEIVEILKNKGLTRMFDVGFNSIVFGENLAVEKVLQEARVSTDEGGTVGAAVTMIEMDVMVGGDIQTPEVLLNRPFFFVIEETSTGTILFMGAVTKL